MTSLQVPRMRLCGRRPTISCFRSLMSENTQSAWQNGGNARPLKLFVRLFQ
jgi:hypothetical protein